MRSLRIVRALLVGSVLLAGCREEEAPPPPVRPVLSIVAAPGETKGAVFAGTIEPRYSSTLAFSVPGRIVARDVDVGDRVSERARLAALDALPLDLAVVAARADLANASAQRANAEASEKRLRALLEQRTVSDAQYEAVQQATEAARAAVIQAQAALDKILDQRSHADLRAEFDGVVTAVMAEVGQTVAPGQPIVTVARPDVREAVIDVPDDIAATLHEGSRIGVVPQISEAEQIVGRVREIAPRIDASTKSRRIRIALDDPPVSFRLGTTITARLTETSGSRIDVPTTALLEDGAKTSVWIVDPETRTVSQHEVGISARGDGVATVATGLKPGDRVVTVGVHSLTQGQRVTISGEARR